MKKPEVGDLVRFKKEAFTQDPDLQGKEDKYYVILEIYAYPEDHDDTENDYVYVAGVDGYIDSYYISRIKKGNPKVAKILYGTST